MRNPSRSESEDTSQKPLAGWIDQVKSTFKMAVSPETSSYRVASGAPRKGRATRQKLTELVTDFRSKGYEVSEQVSVGPGRVVDFVAKRGKDTIVSEVGTSDYLPSHTKYRAVALKKMLAQQPEYRDAEVAYFINDEAVSEVQNREFKAVGVHLVTFGKSADEFISNPH